MKKIKLLLLVILSSCITHKTIEKTGIEEISFGSGGGFTGEVKTYKLSSNGKLFEKGVEIKKLESKSTLKFFNQAKQLKDIDYNKPGNMYSFLEIKTKNKTNRIVWSDGSTDIDKRIIELYAELITNTKQTQNGK